MGHSLKVSLKYAKGTPTSKKIAYNNVKWSNTANISNSNSTILWLIMNMIKRKLVMLLFVNFNNIGLHGKTFQASGVCRRYTWRKFTINFLRLQHCIQHCWTFLAKSSLGKQSHFAGICSKQNVEQNIAIFQVNFSSFQFWNKHNFPWILLV